MGCERHRVQCFVDDLGVRNSRSVNVDQVECLSRLNRVGLTPGRHLRSAPMNGHRETGPAGPFGAISRLPFSENRRIADDKNVNGSRTWLAVCPRQGRDPQTSLYRRAPTRLTPPFKLPPAL